MTQTTDPKTSDELAARAADSGAGATANFRQSGKTGSAQVDPERVALLAGSLIKAANDLVREHGVSYDEYNALKSWLISVGEDGEWPLFLDVWLEHSVEEVNTSHRKGSKGTIEGPYYVPGAPEQDSPATIPMREDEPGTPLVFAGQVRDVDGTPLSNAVVDLWHADANGFYSQFAPGLDQWNLRVRVRTDADGRYEINTVQPAPYQIPTDGACGKLIAAAGWHAWRPAHLHVKVEAPDHETLTAQLYFPGDAHNDDDIASAVKPELLLDVSESEGKNSTVYDVVLYP